MLNPATFLGTSTFNCKVVWWPWSQNELDLQGQIFKKLTLLLIFLLLNGFTSFLETTFLGTKAFNCQVVSWPWPQNDLDIQGQIFKKTNLAHNFLITELIHFIFGHNIPWDKSFQLPSSLMTLTPKWPWPSRSNLQKSAALGALSSYSDILVWNKSLKINGSFIKWLISLPSL